MPALTELYELDENLEPIEGEPIGFVAGDPLDIEFLIEDTDLSVRTITAQIRKSSSENSEVLASFEVSRTKDGDDTLIALHLAGDSAVGAKDGPTRKLPRSCRGDVQLWGVDGADFTLAGFDLERIGDVSR